MQTDCTVGHYLIDRLHRLGLRHLFSIAGDYSIDWVNSYRAQPDRGHRGGERAQPRLRGRRVRPGSPESARSASPACRCVGTGQAESYLDAVTTVIGEPGLADLLSTYRRGVTELGDERLRAEQLTAPGPRHRASPRCRRHPSPGP